LVYVSSVSCLLASFTGNLFLQVRADQSDEASEWIVGKTGHKEGLFPKAFVQLAQTDIVEEKPEAAELNLSDVSFGMDNVFGVNVKR